MTGGCASVIFCEDTTLIHRRTIPRRVPNEEGCPNPPHRRRRSDVVVMPYELSRGAYLVGSASALCGDVALVTLPEHRRDWTIGRLLVSPLGPWPTGAASSSGDVQCEPWSSRAQNCLSWVTPEVCGVPMS